MDLQSGKFGFVHPLQGNNLSRASSVSLTNKTWYHLHNQVDLENGKAQLFVNGSLALSETFDSSLALKNDIESEWIIGSGTISSVVDEIRISNRARSSDWLLATYQNQKATPSFPTPPNALVGPPSFTSLKQFTIPAEKPFSHLVKATGQPTAYVGTGLPSGLLLNALDGNLSGIPATAGNFSPNLRAVYSNGSQASQNININVLAGVPKVSLLTPQSGGSSSLQIPFEI